MLTELRNRGLVQVAKSPRGIYAAPTVEGAGARFREFAHEWRPLYPATIRSWEKFVPFLKFPVELRRIRDTTNAIESLNARFRRPVR